MKRLFKAVQPTTLNRRVLISVGTAIVLLGSAVGIGFLLRDNAASAVKVTGPIVEVTATAETTTTTIPKDEANPPNVVLPELGGQTLAKGSESETVKAYKQRLKDLRFDPGDVDTSFDTPMVYAVETLQKVKGLEPTGRIGEAERAALNTFTWPKPLEPNGEAKRFEVDVEKQVGTLYENYRIKLMTTVSTGAGNYYCWVPKTGGTRICEYGDTPSGRYTFYTRVNGWQDGDLGKIYNPVYFNGGIAVHGYQSVPTKAASHGCVRIPMYVAEYFPSLVSLGEPVYVFGGSDGRRPVTRTPIPADAKPAPAPSTNAPSPAPTTAAPAPEPTTTTTAPAPTTPTTPET